MHGRDWTKPDVAALREVVSVATTRLCCRNLKATWTGQQTWLFSGLHLHKQGWAALGPGWRPKTPLSWETQGGPPDSTQSQLPLQDVASSAQVTGVSGG